jgi:ATP-dependent RNA helicase RhlB
VRRIEERLTRDGISAVQMSVTAAHPRPGGFREGKIRVMVATDVAGRGIRVETVIT